MAYVQRVRDSEVHSSKQDTNITLLPPKDQESLCKRALEDCKSPQLGMTTTQQCFLDTTEQLHRRTQSSCDSELRIHAMANLPNPSLEWERAPEVPPLTEELLSVSCWEIAIKVVFPWNTNVPQIRVNTRDTLRMAYLFV